MKAWLLVAAVLAGSWMGAGVAHAGVTASEGCTLVLPGSCSYVAEHSGGIFAVGDWRVVITRAGGEQYEFGRGAFDVRAARDVIRPGDRVSVFVPHMICVVWLPTYVAVGPNATASR